MIKFEAFNIKYITHTKNFDAYILENATSKLSPSDDFTHDRFFVELFYRPLVSYNITNWRIFDDDQQIINFLHSKYTFKGLMIDDEQHEALF